MSRVSTLFLCFLMSVAAAVFAGGEDQSARFKSFVYPFAGRGGWPHQLKWQNLDEPKTVKLVDGKWREPDNDSDQPFSRLTLESVKLGDVTGDGVNEAIVVLRYDTGGTQYSHYVYIYSLRGSSPTLLAFFHSGDRAASGLYKVYAKLFGQMRVVSQNLHRDDVSKVIGQYREAILKAETIPDIRFLEAQAAAEYWSAWQSLPVIFPTNDLKHVPAHWCRFDMRRSLLTNSSRLATNPINAILNYLYALLEVESTLAASAVGLDPCIGFVHVDAPYRDNLACDIMEVGRPFVDAYVIDLVSRPLRKDWFFEERNGNCRLTSPLANHLSKTSRLWARAIAPITEWVAQALDTPTSNQAKRKFRPTLLTQTRKRQARGNPARTPRVVIPKSDSICVRCGNNRAARGKQHCWRCGRWAS